MESCAICLEKITHKGGYCMHPGNNRLHCRSVLKCSHEFHKCCLINTFNVQKMHMNNLTCPLCRHIHKEYVLNKYKSIINTLTTYINHYKDKYEIILEEENIKDPNKKFQLFIKYVMDRIQKKTPYFSVILPGYDITNSLYDIIVTIDNSKIKYKCNY